MAFTLHILYLLQVSRSKYPLGTKVAKQFHGKRYEGELRGYDALEDYYCIYYEDGDSDELDCAEMDQAVQDYDQEVICSDLSITSWYRLTQRCIGASNNR
jgi:hypothetical protein